MPLRRTIHSFPLKVRYDIFILAMTPPHAEWLDHPIIYLKYDRVAKVVWRDLDPTYHSLMLTDRTCAWVAERALFSHFVFMYASPWPMKLPLGLRRNIKHFAYRPMKLEYGSSHVLNLTAIRRQLLYITTIHIVIPQKAERDLHGITTDDRILMHIALLFLMRYRVAIVGQAEQDGHGDIQSGMTLRPVRHALSGVKGYRHLNMFYHPHGQAVRNSIIEFSRTDVLWTREEDLGLLEDRKPVVSRLANMVPMLRMRCYLSLASACSGI